MVLDDRKQGGSRRFLSSSLHAASTSTKASTAARCPIVHGFLSDFLIGTLYSELAL